MDCRSTTVTGKRLGLSQPAVTAHLQRLEDVVGQPLFVASGRTKEPTPMARALAATILGPITSLERSLAEIASEYSDPTRLTLRIACRTFRAAWLSLIESSAHRTKPSDTTP